MKPTHAQEAAIYTHDKNLIVLAGAGSGKTHVLVERYLALLERHADWPLNALVAITFTKKAAGEMRDRVRRELEKRLLAASTIGERLRWADLLASMDSARIDTIHGLCATLLRANAAEAGVDPDFEVLDETAARILLEAAIDDALRALVSDSDPAAALFAEYDARTIREVLSDADMMAARLPDLPENLAARWRAEWEADAAGRIDKLADFIGVNIWEPVGDDGMSASWQTCNEVQAALRQTEDVYERIEALKRIKAIRLPGKLKAIWGDDGNEAKADLTMVKEGVVKTLGEIGEPPGDLDARAAELLALWLSLIRRVQATFYQAKERQGALDFNDLEARTRDLLNQYPAVRARYQGREFKHLLVDEFQDTNAAQWDIIRALADPATPGSLFVVGDAKQSIYAFRGADVSVFGAVRQQIIGAGGDFVPLVESFRTHQPLVECFNQLFGILLTRDEGSPVRDYEVTLDEPMTASRQTAPGEAPVIEFLLIERKLADDARRSEAVEIARRLQAMVADGLPVYSRREGRVRPAQYGDMALLFQSMTQITTYEEAFKTMGLPFVTLAGRGYYSRQEVWDLLNLLRALHNPADNLSLAAALRSPLFSLSDDALLGLRLMGDENGQPVALRDALTKAVSMPVMGISDAERPQVEFAAHCLDGLHRLAGRITVYELLREALALTGYLATLTSLPDGARRRGNVEKLLDKAQSSGKITLSAFSQYLSDLSAREVREGEAVIDVEGLVTLMTVHASKGLEFPVVVLADAGRDRDGSRDGAVLYDAQYGLACKVYDEQNNLFTPYAYRRAADVRGLREEAERKRLLYVAATRAQDYLLVSGSLLKAGKATGWLRHMLQAFGLADEDGTLIEKPENEPLTYAYSWGTVRVACPADLTEEEYAPHRHESTGWDHPAVQNGQPLPGEKAAPLLLQPVEVERTAPARHLTATQIADLGGAHYSRQDEQPRYRDRFRRAVLFDAPSHVEEVSRFNQNDDVSGRQVGEIVHQALRHWRFPDGSNDLTDLLRSYAWQQGIISEERLEKSVQRAQSFLQRFTRSDVYQWVNASKQAQLPVYSELPFIFQNDRRIIHGIIDILFQRPDGTWAIVDYKTSSVGKAPTETALREHARRYHLQIGVYAAAVRGQLNGITPAAHIHYLPYLKTVTVHPDEWRESLENLENLIGSVISDELAL